MRKRYFLVLFSFIFVSKAFAFTLEHEFDVFIGQFNASRTSFVYSISDKSYELRSYVRTYGVFNSLYPFQAAYLTSGVIKDEKLITQKYSYSAKSMFNTRKKELIYNDEGMPIYNISSKNDKSRKREIKTTENIENTNDLQTVFAELVEQYNKNKTCASRMEVFDGKRRFGVVFRDEGVEDIKANKYSNFEGSAVKCSMYIDGMGSKGEDLLWELSMDRPVYFWIMEYGEKSRPFIARAEIKKTGYGRVLIYTKKVKVYE